MEKKLHPAGRRSILPACFACAGIGAAVFVLVYGIRPLDVTYDAWILNGYVETDITQRYAGWLAYRNADAWLPLTFSPLISFPFGGRTSLCDSIPFFEIFFRALAPVLPATFQFEGILCLLNLMLQGFCGALVMSLFTDDRLTAVLGGSVFCLSPVLLERLFRHTSLSFQWMLLLAIWLYFTCQRRGRLSGLLGFAVLGVFSVWVHLYFTPMVLGFFLAAVLDGARARGNGTKRAPQNGESPAQNFSCENTCRTADTKKDTAAAYKSIIRRWVPFVLFGLCAAGAVVSAALLGLLSLGTSNTSGYGTMGLNLNALFNPKSLGPEWWVPGRGTIDWSRFLPMRAYAENGLESFNYLGLGVLAVLGLAALYGLVRFCRAPKAAAARLAAAIRAHLFLSGFMLVSTLFAVSNVVCAFSHVLLRLPLTAGVESVFSAFRASGRLFWSVNSLLVLGALVFLVRHVPAAVETVLRKGGRGAALSAGHTHTGKAAVNLALAALLAVQAVDLSPALAVKHADFAAESTWSGQQAAEQLIDAMDACTVLYNLELRDDRAVCAWLLGRGIASNFWLISRDSYGVPALTADMADTTQALLAGRDPYPSAAYCTTDADTAAALGTAGCTVTPCGAVWLVFPQR